MFGSIITLCGILLCMRQLDGRRYKNIYYRPRVSDQELIRNRIEHIQLPSKKQRFGDYSYNQLSPLDKEYLAYFWSEIKNQKVDRMRVKVGITKFKQINERTLKEFSTNKKTENPHIPSREAASISIKIPHKWQLLLNTIKEL